jgi:hypothetical protein
MTSKKRTGNDPEALASRERELRNDYAPSKAAGIREVLEAGGDSKAPGNMRGSTEAFQAGRRSLAYELIESGMLSPGRLGLEILYLLPDDFVQFYQDLFHQALQVKDDSVMHGRSGGLEKAGGRQGMQLGSQDRGPQAGTSGKRWKNTPMAVGNETALKAKQAMDKGLQDLVRDAKRYLTSERDRKTESRTRRSNESRPNVQGPGGVVKAVQASDTRKPKVAAGSNRCAGAKCGRFLKAGWTFCPECGTRTG